MRSCVGCRNKRPQAELIRFVASGSELLPDLGRRLPGRGAYACPKRPCVEQAFKRRIWGRALRASVVTSEVQLMERLSDALSLSTTRGYRCSEHPGVDGNDSEEMRSRLAYGSEFTTLRVQDEACARRRGWIQRALSEFTLTRADDMTRQPPSRVRSRLLDDNGRV